MLQGIIAAERPSREWFRGRIKGHVGDIRGWVVILDGRKELLNAREVLDYAVVAYTHMFLRRKDVLDLLIEKACQLKDAHPYISALTGISNFQAVAIMRALDSLGQTLKGTEVIFLPICYRLGTELGQLLSLDNILCPKSIKRPVTPEYFQCFNNPHGLGHFLENNVIA